MIDFEMKVSALVLTRNRPNNLFKCLDSIRKQTVKPDEIIILDNGSEPKFEITKYKAQLNDCILLKSDSNLGCPGGRNLLIENSNGDFLLFVDDDGYISPDTLENSIKYFDNIKDLAIVTFRIIDPATGKIRDGIAEDIEPFYHHTFGGGSCIIKKSEIIKTGLYSIDYLRQGEEHDLALRLINRKNKILYAPDCILYHEESKNSKDIVLNSQLSTISSAWRYLPYHYAFLRTIINYLRLIYKTKSLRINYLINAISFGLKNRNPITYDSYTEWRKLVNDVKKKFNLQT